jgi:hypothetical protein
MGGRAPGSRTESSFRARSVVGVEYKSLFFTISDLTRSQSIRKKDLPEKRFPFPGDGIDFDDLAGDF